MEEEEIVKRLNEIGEKYIVIKEDLQKNERNIYIMEDKEILANLKIAYLKLDDILENADRIQIDDVSYKNLSNSMEILEKKYNILYKKIEKDTPTLLYYKKDIIIAPQIYNDYYDIKNKEFVAKVEYNLYTPFIKATK